MLPRKGLNPVVLKYSCKILMHKNHLIIIMLRRYKICFNKNDKFQHSKKQSPKIAYNQAPINNLNNRKNIRCIEV